MNPNTPLPQEALVQQVRDLALRTRRAVNTQLGGVYHSVFKGQGLSFLSVRPYEPGDDIRDIDWNVTARTHVPHVKRYTEERELHVMLLLDTSPSFSFGTQKRPKNELAAELGALLTLAAITNNDSVGLVLFDHKIQQFIRPQRGKNHALRIMRELLTGHSEYHTTNIGQALQETDRFLKQRGIVFLMSDFLVPPKTFFKPLLALQNRHDVMAFILRDPLEQAWPNVGLIRVHDMETGELVWADTGSKRWRNTFQAQMQAQRQAVIDNFQRIGIPYLEMAQHQDYTRALVQFFQKRMKQGR